MATVHWLPTIFKISSLCSAEEETHTGFDQQKSKL